MYTCLSALLAHTLLLLAVVTRFASGWKNCSISLEDHWIPAESRSLPEHMLTEYDRRYTCKFRPGALSATGYTFQSACTSKTFTTPEVKSCLAQRRVIFLGDSLSVQQGDSLLGMLGWHPSFLTLGDPQNWKMKRNEEGNQVPTLKECWRDKKNYAGRSERCYDIYGGTMARSAGSRRLIEKGVNPTDVAGSERHGSGEEPHLRPSRSLHHKHHVSVDVVIDEDGDGLGQEEEAVEEETSVHVRMFPRPTGENWLQRAVSDFNETRSSDIFVVNFGAHYDDTVEDELNFQVATAALLDEMAKLGETATVMWREIGPAHFPSENGTYKSFTELPQRVQRTACCTGTPPLHLERNLWVDKYIDDNGLADRVKLLRIYRMSSFRGSAHHSCHLAPPADPLDGPQGDASCPVNEGSIDCLHFSETGVIEAWNGLMLNHICPEVD